MATPRTALPTTLLLTFTLAACSSSSPPADGGGGGGEGGGEGQEQGGGGGQGFTATPSPESLHFFRGSLNAVDPRNPGKVFVIDDDEELGLGVFSPMTPVVAGTFDAAGPGFVDLHAGGLCYAKGKEAFYISAEQREDDGGEPLAPEPVALGTFPGRIIGFEVGVDLGGSEPLTVVVEQLRDEDAEDVDEDSDADDIGLDSALFADVVVIDGDEVSAPVRFPGSILAPLVDPADGSHVGWLGREDGQITFVDTEIVPTTLGAGDSVFFLGAAPAGSVFLSVDGKLAVFDVASRELVFSSFELPALDFSIFGHVFPEATAVDESRIYLAVRSDEGSTIEIHSIDASGTARLLQSHSDAGDFGVEGIAVAGDRVVYAYPLGGIAGAFSNDVVLRSVKRDGSDPLELDRGAITPASTFAANFVLFSNALLTAGDRVFYDKSVTSLTAFSHNAHSIRADGTGATTLENRQWVGSTLASNSLPGFGRVQVSQLFAVESLHDFDINDFDLSDLGVGGSELHVVDVRDAGQLGTRLGTIPEDLLSFNVAPGYGTTRLGLGIVVELVEDEDGISIDDEDDGTTIGGAELDILLFDTTREDSLRVLTDREDADHFIIDLF